MDINNPEKPSVYFDIDGTLGKWYSDGKGLSLEEMLDPANHYFRDIEPHETMIMLAEQLSDRGADVCVVSAAYESTIPDKKAWLKEHMPFIPENNIFFTPIGEDKSQFVKGNADVSILIDDYNKNLEAWQENSRFTNTAYKAINTVNSHQSEFREIDIIHLEEKLNKARGIMDDLDIPESKKEDYLDSVAYSVAQKVKDTTLNVMDRLHEIKDAIEKSNEAVKKSYESYVNEYGEDAVLDLENFTKVYELADKAEQYMNDRGEYDYAPDERCEWLKGGDGDRDEAFANILNSLIAVENNGTERLIEWIDAERTMEEVSEEDTSFADSIIEGLEQHKDILSLAYDYKENESQVTVYINDAVADIDELKDHLSMNGYSVTWNEDGHSFVADTEEIDYIKTILDDRSVVYSTEHSVDEITLTDTMSLYENDESAKDLTFADYVKQNGFADGTVYSKDEIAEKANKTDKGDKSNKPKNKSVERD